VAIMIAAYSGHWSCIGESRMHNYRVFTRASKLPANVQH